MTFLVIFLVLCLIESIIIYLKWDEIKGYKKLADELSDFSGQDWISRFSDKVINSILRFKKIFFVVLILVNSILAGIISVFVNLIYQLIQ